MTNSDKVNLESIARAVALTNLVVEGTIATQLDNYELVTYYDEVVILDSQEQEVLAIPRSKPKESDYSD